MGQRCTESDLTLEPLGRGRRHELRAQDLQRDQLPIAVSRGVHDGRPAHADLTLERVAVPDRAFQPLAQLVQRSHHLTGRGASRRLERLETSRVTRPTSTSRYSWCAVN